MDELAQNKTPNREAGGIIRKTESFNDWIEYVWKCVQDSKITKHVLNTSKTIENNGNQ